MKGLRAYVLGDTLEDGTQRGWLGTAFDKVACCCCVSKARQYRV